MKVTPGEQSEGSFKEKRSEFIAVPVCCLSPGRGDRLKKGNE